MYVEVLFGSPFNIPTRFVDHDMIMQFHGGGVGHKSTRNATDQLLDDRDHGKESV